MYMSYMPSKQDTKRFTGLSIFSLCHLQDSSCIISTYILIVHDYLISNSKLTTMSCDQLQTHPGAAYLT